MTQEHESPSALAEVQASANSNCDPASLSLLGAGRSVWRQAAEYLRAPAAREAAAASADERKDDDSRPAPALSLIGPLQLAWLRAAQAGQPRSPVIGRRPSYDDCE